MNNRSQMKPRMRPVTSRMVEMKQKQAI
ncbi:unnamed protein product [Acanthoscelides obtectus]|uniref:Uncharacterized protein n=1 Tax=Acanthoscelides obtectus TaxID=200917 RepID=A0A9P0Q044_ACAOB|nr:unnamed protein product [Acanthoscelides obtectus]CAK1664128.1 hypothetical protein AOBTE_LOCUS24070 [Acanthoscelides obtectus]